MATLALRHLPIQPQIIHSRMGLKQGNENGKQVLTCHFTAYNPSFGTKHMLNAAKRSAICIKKHCYLHQKAKLFASKSSARCIILQENEQKRHCFRRTNGR